jgi:heme exporter protein A
MLQVSNLGCVRGNRRLFSNLSFSVEPNAFVQVTGPNGSGKTSLLRMLCGLLKFEEGSVTWNGEGIHSLAEEFSAQLTYIGHRNGLKEELTAVENLRIASGLKGKDLSNERVHSSLAAMGLGGREELPLRFLSQGQQRRAALARLLIEGTKLWILDEVLTSLDKAATELMHRLIEDHLNSGGMAIVATHQEFKFAAGSFQRVELA